jgi:hypothetical protein
MTVINKFLLVCKKTCVDSTSQTLFYRSVSERICFAMEAQSVVIIQTVVTRKETDFLQVSSPSPLLSDSNSGVPLPRNDREGLRPVGVHTTVAPHVPHA